MYCYPQSALLSSLDWGYRESAHSGLVVLPRLARFGLGRSGDIPATEGCDMAWKATPQKPGTWERSGHVPGKDWLM